MIANKLSRSALELPLKDRLELERRLVESVVQPAMLTETVKNGVRRIEDVITGRAVGFTEKQYRAAVR